MQMQSDCTRLNKRGANLAFFTDYGVFAAHMVDIRGLKAYNFTDNMKMEEADCLDFLHARV